MAAVPRDHDEFGLHQSKLMHETSDISGVFINVVDSKSLERDTQTSSGNLRKLDCAGKAAQRPTFPHPALADAAEDRKLRILHVLRAPLGGLFRHVLDLTREQIARGHSVGLVTDSMTGGERADAVLADLEPSLALGLLRLPMRRHPHPLDLFNAIRIAAHIRSLELDVVHGHGSKGGLYARLPGFVGGLVPQLNSAVRAYTPHGGSFNYRSYVLIEKLYMWAERQLARTTDIFLFESGYIAKCCAERVGEVRGLTRIVTNGIGPAEFVAVEPAQNAADLLYVGELRAAKGIDTLIDALAMLKRKLGPLPRLVLVGSGPDGDKLTAQAAARGVGTAVTFAGVLPAREAFTLGRILVVPSRAESLPYIVIEAAGARIPMIATNVGGIGEIFGPYKDRLIGPDDPEHLAEALSSILARDPAELQREAEMLAAFVASKFKITDMANAVLAGYRDAIARKARAHPAPVQSLARSG
ncbi:MAG: glycosyltransferase family 4 protein [Beijerinckiaceae bacterium]